MPDCSANSQSLASLSVCNLLVIIVAYLVPLSATMEDNFFVPVDEMLDFEDMEDDLENVGCAVEMLGLNDMSRMNAESDKKAINKVIAEFLVSFELDPFPVATIISEGLLIVVSNSFSSNMIDCCPPLTFNIGNLRGAAVEAKGSRLKYPIFISVGLCSENQGIFEPFFSFIMLGNGVAIPPTMSYLVVDKAIEDAMVNEFKVSLELASAWVLSNSVYFVELSEKNINKGSDAVGLVVCDSGYCVNFAGLIDSNVGKVLATVGVIMIFAHEGVSEDEAEPKPKMLQPIKRKIDSPEVPV